MQSLLRPLAFAFGLAILVAGRGDVAAGAAPLPDERAIVHALNRLAFGPRPGDVQRIAAFGLQKYIDQQLRPDRVEDAGMAVRLAGLPTSAMSSRDLIEQYELPMIAARRERKEAASAGNAAAPPTADPMSTKANR